MLKPAAGEGYFDDVFAIDADGKRLALIRTDGATFSKLEIFDTGSGKPTGGFDLPDKTLFPVEMELLRAATRASSSSAARRPTTWRRCTRFASTAPGKPAGKVGPATAFGRPPADGTARAQPAGRVHAQARDEGRGGHLHGRALRRHDAGARRQAARPQGRRHRRAEAAGRALHRLLRRLHARAERTPGRLRQEGRCARAVQDGDHRRDQRQGRQGRADRRHHRLGPDRPAAAGAPRPVALRRAQRRRVRRRCG